MKITFPLAVALCGGMLLLGAETSFKGTTALSPGAVREYNTLALRGKGIPAGRCLCGCFSSRSQADLGEDKYGLKPRQSKEAA